MILRKSKLRHTFSEMDFLIAEAVTLLEGERCAQCGLPKWICQSNDPDIEIDLVKEECNAVRKKAKREEKDQKDKKDTAGVAYGFEPYTHSGTPLEQFREPFYRERNEKYEEKVAMRPVLPREHPPDWRPQEEAS